MLDSKVLEMIGLAFVTGYTARKAMEEDEENEKEDEEIKTGVIKLDGEKAKEFVEYIENNFMNKKGDK